MKRFVLDKHHIDQRVKELRNAIAEIEAEIADLERVKSVVPLLQQLRFHHASQAKPHTAPCAKSYNEALASEIVTVLGRLE